MIKITCYDKNGETISNLYQWDMNIRVVVHGLTGKDITKLRFHFANQKSRLACVVTPTAVTEGATAIIPNELFMVPDVIFLYVYETDPSNEEGRTIATIRIPVMPRQQPNEYAYVPTTFAKKIVDGLTVIDGIIYLTANGEVVGEGVPAGGGSIYYSINDTSAVSHGFVSDDIIAIAEEVS